MTVHKQQKITKKPINDHNQMIHDHDQNDVNNDETQNATTEILDPIEDSNVGRDVIPNYVTYEVNETYVTPIYRSPNDFEPLSGDYFREWSGVEQWYSLSVNPEPLISWSPSPSSPPPPLPFEINSEFITETFEEDNIQNLVSALHNMILSSSGLEIPNGPYFHVHIHHHIDPIVPDGVWVDPSLLNEEEPRPRTGSDCSNTP